MALADIADVSLSLQRLQGRSKYTWLEIVQNIGLVCLVDT